MVYGRTLFQDTHKIRFVGFLGQEEAKGKPIPQWRSPLKKTRANCCYIKDRVQFHCVDVSGSESLDEDIL